MKLSAVQVSCCLCESESLINQSFEESQFVGKGPTAGRTELHYWRADL